MQRRLLVSTLAVAVVAVLLLGIPLGFVLGHQQASEATAELNKEANDLAKSLQARISTGLPVPVRQFAAQLHDRYVIVSDHNSKPIRVGVRPPKGQRVSESASTSDVRVTVETNASYVTNRVYGAGLQIGGLALLAGT